MVMNMRFGRKSPIDHRRVRLRVLLPIVSFVVATVVTLITVACVSSDDSRSLLLVVGPELRDCVGVAPMKCLVVNGELFYDEIKGFDYEQGFIYRLEVVRYDAWPDMEKPPQDASRYGYRLIRIISRTPAG